MNNVNTQWDVERSLRECPPELLYKPEDGVIFEKRHVVKASKLDFDGKDQPKEQSSQNANKQALRDSIEVNGWIYSQPPLVYEQDGPKLRGKAGFNRYGVLGSLGYTHIMVDKVRYTSPLNALKHSIGTNDHLPSQASRAKDFAKIVLKCMDDGWIGKDDDSIKEFIRDIAKSKTAKVQNSIFKLVRGRKSKHQHIDPYDKDTSSEKCQKLGLPFSGDKNFDECGKYGYSKPRGTFKALAHDAMSLLIKTKGRPVYVTGYIENASDDPETLQVQRQDWLDDFKRDVIVFIKDFYQYNEGKELKNPIKIYPIGFLPQNVTPISDGSGEVKETGLVNVDGSPKVRTFESILEDHPTSQV